MNSPHQVDRPDLVKILETFGEEICKGKKEYFIPIVTSSSYEGSLTDFTLYFLAQEISYEYRAINVEIKNQLLKIRFFTLATKQSEHYDVDISTGTTTFRNKLDEIKNFGLFKAALEFLINQTLLKREYREAPIKKQIIPGQARVAVLNNGDRINVGWIRIEGDEVVYYTGQGLYNIWKPNMTKDEQEKAEALKHKSEKELKEIGYLDVRKISDFKAIE